MSEALVELELSWDTAMVVHSAANEARIFYPEDRARVGGPSAEESQQLLRSVDRLLDHPGSAPRVWVLSEDLLGPALRLIPACLEILDEVELDIRTMETPASFAAAQAELVRVVEATGRMPEL